ncbi:adenine nucleotide transporter 1 [Actinidia rufa]|uniref:Adenine nucleotide transporter 1 n=1 Tax=Actinidia rufa TaxID=165716 RepID=A0A7J0G771_9ERIC|nr:adenine nucleotide transporter 1 [Actinidia rufa]
MAPEDVVAKTSETAVSTIVNLAQEAKISREGVKAPNHAFYSICKSLVAGGVAGGVHQRNKLATNQILGHDWVSRLLTDTSSQCIQVTYCCRSIRTVKDFAPEDAELTPLLRLGAGACAGIIAMSATYPMDMVRGRLTVQTEASPRQYRGIFHALSTVFREEGPRALYKGWLPSVIGVIPYVGLNFAVYEFLKDWLIKSRPFGRIEDSELSVTTKLACGAAAGTVGQTVAYPLDVIRRRMQMVGWKDAASVVTGDGKSKAPLEYSGMVDAFRKTVRHEGVGALDKGLVPNSVKVSVISIIMQLPHYSSVVPSIAIAFVTYEVVKDILGVEMRISD